MDILRYLLQRQQPLTPCRCWVKSGIVATVAIGLIGWLGQSSNLPLLIAPFGATCVLLFGAPHSPFAQPANVIGGHLLASAAALLLHAVLPAEWWAIALVVGLTIALMAATRLTHPPAGGDSVLVFFTDPGPMFLLSPILLGTIALVGLAAVIHRLPSGPFPTTKCD
ncbi:MAG: hypothetical protein FD149_369 [Rhodospirillaceae bacterium]|nr:MAG: hypothetical protein FD149_369 [Rhodospirillaceae bacterium]